MSESMKIVLAVVGVFVIGFVMVGLSKEDPSIATNGSLSDDQKLCCNSNHGK